MAGRTRTLIAGSLLVAVVIGAGIVWFAAFRERKTPTEVKTTAELLVGTWKIDVTRHPKVWEQVELTYEFSRDGRFTIQATDPITGPQLRTGTYQWEGNTLMLSAVPATKYPAETWEVEIEKLTDEELVTASKPDSLGRQEWDYFKRSTGQ